ncbi:hypothetical protein MUK42_28121 [Musa troglodytarum]|uniref:Uncharacterized protein n=1 Tax=Musa troglodytarum TaxID=320322 RepID=A0A9E7EXP3_9LILI|nr:hypothetical protein MUK42_28121 [Musa troglodytarum]
MDAGSDLRHSNGVVSPDRGFGFLTVASFLFLTFNSLNAAYQSRGDPRALAFVSFCYIDLLMLFFCLRQLEKLDPDDPPVHKKRTLAAVWVLFTALNLAFAWRAAEILPPLLAVAVGGFYVLIIYPQADGDLGRSMIPSAEQNV